MQKPDEPVIQDCIEWVDGPYARSLIWFRDRLSEIIEAIPAEFRNEARIAVGINPGTKVARFVVEYRAQDYPGDIIDRKDPTCGISLVNTMGLV
jgi:hypothetical protein